jgi:putative ABC transport system permease protein
MSERLALAGEVIASGLSELWAHKLRSVLTLTLLMLGVFALVVMTSLLGGIMDKVRTGFQGMGWEGALVLQPRAPGTLEQRKRFQQSPGLRLEDLARITLPSPKVRAWMPRAVRSVPVRVAGGTERAWAIGTAPDYLAVMNRRIAGGRGLTEDDRKRRSPVAVLGATLASKVLGGADPVGREIVVEGVSFRVVGVLAGQMIFNEDAWYDANGILVPLEAYMDRLEPGHRLSSLIVKLAAARDLDEVSAMLLARARQAHHGIEDVEVKNLDAEAARNYRQFLNQMRGWKVVLLSLAGTVLLVGGVGVLSVMLISCSDRRFEIGLRKALGASDREIFGQFLLEAAVLGALGALAGTLAGALACQALSARFPYGLVVNPLGLALAWATALALALGFGLYPALRAMRLSPMEAMR